ncbi:MAG: site-specific integrase [Actinobacteria bacterium]|nr:site-specific integrase [Actinomycetota bacterium]
MDWKVVSVPNVLYEGDPKSESSIREITIDDTTVQVLREWRQVKRRKPSRGQGGLVRVGVRVHRRDWRGIHPTRLSTNFTKALKTSGLRQTTPHGLRHLHATLLLDAGVPVKVVSARLGHASTAFTQDRYIKVTERAGRAAALATAHFMTA